MKLYNNIMATVTVAIFVFGCGASPQKTSFLSENPSAHSTTIFWVNSITELTDTQYPHNPDISIRSSLDGVFSHSKIKIERTENGYSLAIFPKNNKSDTVLIQHIDLSLFLPSAPTHVKSDPYLTKIAIINQEWNRMQVNFTGNQFLVKGNNAESQNLSRVDLARNCINAYLWELIFYDNDKKPVYHGWFNFPKSLYAQLFEEKNNLSFSIYKASLEDWKTPESKQVNLKILRDDLMGVKVDFENKNHVYYPELGERKKKKMNILYPTQINSITDFLTDSTQFATFSPPGYYNQKDPRKTQLHRLRNLKEIQFFTVEIKNSQKELLTELRFRFENPTDTTLLYIGGINTDSLPVLSIENAKNGYQMPMGIGNFSFYQNYAEIANKNQLESPYYGLLTDEKGNWLDSHEIGIDGPLMHLDKEGNLHVWILSFERHSFVGHYVIQM